MKIAQFLGSIGVLILAAGCAAERPVSSYYHDSEGNVLSSTPTSTSDNTTVLSPPPRYDAVNDQLQISPTPTGRYDQERVYAPSADDYFSLHVRGLSETDRTLGQRILEGLRADTVLPTLLPIVNIEVSQGRVIVRGTVQNYEQKRQILAAVRQSAGVSNVIDELQVSPPR